MTPSQGRSGARFDNIKTSAVCGRCRSWQMTFCDTAGSRMPGGAGSALINCHARQIGYRAALPAIRKLPAPSHCCIPAQHATTRPYLPCQRVPRRPGRSRCTRPQMPSDMCSLSNETFKDEASKTPAPPIRMDSNRSRGICQLHLAGTTQWSATARAINTGSYSSLSNTSLRQ